MIQHIQQTFADYPRQKINQTWFTLMCCLTCTIKCLGSNDYKIPCMNKAKMEWEGALPTVLNVTDAAVPLMETTDSMKIKLSDEENDS